MTIATTKKFSEFTVKLESTTTPGTYVAPCAMTSRSLLFAKEANDTNVPDCADEDVASWTLRDIISKGATISGEGVLSVESIPRWRAAFETDISFNTRIEIGGLLAAGGGHWSGKWHLTSLEIGAERGQRVTTSIEMVSDGPIVWTPAAS